MVDGFTAVIRPVAGETRVERITDPAKPPRLLKMMVRVLLAPRLVVKVAPPKILMLKSVTLTFTVTVLGGKTPAVPVMLTVYVPTANPVVSTLREAKSGTPGAGLTLLGMTVAASPVD